MIDYPISYVAFIPETRELIGSFYQIPLPEHPHWVEVTEEQRVMWPLYMLNEDMTALVLDPRYQPGYEPPEEPEDPPVDPDPEPPVQSEP